VAKTLSGGIMIPNLVIVKAFYTVVAGAIVTISQADPNVKMAVKVNRISTFGLVSQMVNG